MKVRLKPDTTTATALPFPPLLPCRAYFGAIVSLCACALSTDSRVNGSGK